MNREQQIIKTLTNQTIGGQSILLRFYQKVLEEDPSDIRLLELTYFALSVTTIFYLQFSEEDNKNELMDNVTETVLTKSLSAASETKSYDEVKQEFDQRLSDYSTLILKLLDEENKNTPIVPLFIHFYESTMQKSADNEVLNIRKAGKILSQYIIDNIKYVKKEAAA